MTDFEKKIPIKGCPGYFVLGTEIIGKRGKVLKAGKHDIYRLKVCGKVLSAPRFKLVWCAENGHSPQEVPAHFSFYFDEGLVRVTIFSERMAGVRARMRMTVRVKREDYDFLERYARFAKDMIDGAPDAASRLFALINSRRDEYISYARRQCGAADRAAAEFYADQSVFHVWELIRRGAFFVASPVASVKYNIRKLVNEARGRYVTRPISELSHFKKTLS